MKKIICFILMATLLLTSVSTAYAKHGKDSKDKDQGHKKSWSQEKKYKEDNFKEKKQEFKINGSPILKYGYYKLPYAPITKGMGAQVKFDKEKAILTVTKGTTTLIIDYKNKTVTVNGVADAASGIFTAKNSKKSIVLIKYVAKVLGVRLEVDDDEVVVETPGLDYPTNVTVTPVGTTVVSNTLNSSTLYLTAAATIKAGQATGGKAELYVGTKLVATDAFIAATDTSVTFTTSDETPTNAELIAAVPTGGVVSVKLYNAANQSVTSKSGNPTLVTDYVLPSINSISSAIYSVSGGSVYLNVTGAGAVGDTVDVTKLSFYNATVGSTYQLTNAAGTGSTGVVTTENMLTITLGTVDKVILSGLSNNTLILYVAPGALLKDKAGNASVNFTTFLSVPVTVFR